MQITIDVTNEEYLALVSAVDHTLEDARLAESNGELDAEGYAYARDLNRGLLRKLRAAERE